MFPILFLILIGSVLSSKEVCPGGSFTCPDYATCCQLADLTYGCCPMKNAVCCDDHIHCCPENTKCDAGICIKLEGLNVTSHKLTKDKSDCPTCSDTDTCCMGLSPERQEYQCCPFEDAECCDDGKHCCPQGMVCNIPAQQCIGKGYVTEMYDYSQNQENKNSNYRMLIKAQNLLNVICPGSETQCPNGYTCCQLLSGEYGCCPYEHATCCPDHEHCCPENMQCDATSKACTQGLAVTSSVKKILAQPIKVRIVCPDNSTECADGMTCCVISETRFGCCPYADAVCCPDHRHCCPSGNICDEVMQQCLPVEKSLMKKPIEEIEDNSI